MIIPNSCIGVLSSHAGVGPGVPPVAGVSDPSVSIDLAICNQCFCRAMVFNHLWHVCLRSLAAIYPFSVQNSHIF